MRQSQLRTRRASTDNASPLWRAIAVAVTFLATLVVSVVAGVYPTYLLALYLLASLVAFLVYWLDKSAARNGQWRTPENTLHAVGLIGGWPGALVAMHLFRHKSRKSSFRFVFWTTVLLNIGGFLWLASPAGTKAIATVMGTA
jgi:uncharacterized membrane protein YsdA (DUF1294 family)